MKPIPATGRHAPNVSGAHRVGESADAQAHQQQNRAGDADQLADDQAGDDAPGDRAGGGIGEHPAADRDPLRPLWGAGVVGTLEVIESLDR